MTTDEYLHQLPNWQKANLELFRKTIHEAIPGITEEIKWNVPTFIHGKTILFAMSAFKAHTKFNFIHNGALLSDKDGLFNNGLDSKKSRAVDMHENDTIDQAKLLALVKQAAQV